MNKTNTNNISCFYLKSNKDKLIDSGFISNVFNVYLNESLLNEENNILNINNNSSFYLKYSVVDDIDILPSMIFSNVEKLSSIKLPDVYTKISNKAFYGASMLSSIVMNNVTSIGSHAFDGCTRLKEIKLDNVKDLYDYSLAGCGIKSVKLYKSEDDDFMTIYTGLFKDCKNLKEYIDEENNYYIGASAFAGCTSLEKVKVGNFLGSAGRKTIQDCYLIGSEEIYEGEAVEEENTDNTEVLPDQVFAGCSKLNEISFLDDIKEVGVGSMMFCSSIENINAKFNVINKYGLKNCVKLKDIDLSECTTIKEYGLQNCNSLKTIDIDSLENVEIGAFDSCDSLQTVKNNHLSSIPDFMFRNCKCLSSIEGFDNITEVGAEAFMNCQSLLPVDLSHINKFGDYSFSNCSYLVNISLNENAELGNGVFENCTNLREFEIPANITSLPENLFKGCKELNKVIINYHDDSDFNVSALENCNKMSYIEIKESERYSTPNNNCIYDKQNNEIIYVCKAINLFEINLDDYAENVSISDTAFNNCLCNIILIKDVDAPDINANTFKNIRYKNYHILINKNDKLFSKYMKLLGKKHIYSYVVDQETDSDDGNGGPSHAPINHAPINDDSI